MKKVEVWESIDGNIFKTGDECEKYEIKTQFGIILRSIIDDIFYESITEDDFINGIMDAYCFFESWRNE